MGNRRAVHSTMSDIPITSNYDPTAPENPVNLVRSMIGDVREPFFVTDEIILYFWEQTDGNLFATCIPCLRMIGSHYTTMADKTVGRLSISYGAQAQRASSMADNFQAMLEAGGKAITRNWRTKPGVVVLSGGGPKWLGDYRSQFEPVPSDQETPVYGRNT